MRTTANTVAEKPQQMRYAPWWGLVSFGAREIHMIVTKKLIATCYNGSMNSNAELVRQGWALAYRRYSKDYILAEKQAKKTQARGVVWEVPKALAVEKEMSSV